MRHQNQIEVELKSVTESVMNLVTPKAAATLEILFNKPAPDQLRAETKSYHAETVS